MWSHAYSGIHYSAYTSEYPCGLQSSRGKNVTNSGQITVRTSAEKIVARYVEDLVRRAQADLDRRFPEQQNHNSNRRQDPRQGAPEEPGHSDTKAGHGWAKGHTRQISN